MSNPTVARQHNNYIVRKNYEKKLNKKKLVRKKDWQKVESLFGGWGEERSRVLTKGEGS